MSITITPREITSTELTAIALERITLHQDLGELPTTVECFSDLYDYGVDASEYLMAPRGEEWVISEYAYTETVAAITAELWARATTATQPHVVAITKGRLVVGEQVTMVATGPNYSTTCVGIFDGVWLDVAEIGTAMAYFVDGTMGGEYQPAFGFPVAQFNQPINA